MSRYIRAFVPGGTFFFTVVLLERRRRLSIERIHALRGIFAAVRARRPFSIDAVVVLPEHLHALWTLPEGDSDYSTRWSGQGAVLASHRIRRAAFAEPAAPTRTGCVAKAVLRTRDA